jgi:hypothetical protein
MTMRRGSRSLVVALALLATGGVASAHDGRKAVVWATTVNESLVDLGEPGTTPGDRFVFTDDLSRTRRGRVIGFDGGECTSCGSTSRPTASPCSAW